MPTPPTPLDVYLECLHLIQELPPGDRPAVIDALASFALNSRSVLKCPTRSEADAEVE